MAAASTGKVAEGNVGGGTGMICHEFKGGIGTSSGVVGTGAGTFTVGVLVQANYGERRLLRLDGHRIGAILDTDIVAPPSDPSIKEGGSIIIIVATDWSGASRGHRQQQPWRHLPRLLDREPHHCRRNRTNRRHDHPARTDHPRFHATADAVQEAIWNALCAAETMTGHLGRTVQAIPLDLLVQAYHSGHSAESGLAVGEVDG